MADIAFDIQAKEILEAFGGETNVATHTNCMTRLRVKPINLDNVDIDKISSFDYVLRVQVVGGIVQIVIGPGKVNKVEAEFTKLLGNTNEVKIKGEETENNSFGTLFLQYVQKIMFAILPAIMGAALVSATFNIIKILGFDASTVIVTGDDATTNLLAIAAFFLYTLAQLVLNNIGIFIAVSTARAFGGGMAIPLAFGLFIYTVPMAGVELGPLTLQDDMGGIISVVILTIAIVFIEKGLKKVIPNVVSTIFVPFFTILGGFIVMFLIAFPIAAVFNFIVIGAVNFLVNGSDITNIIGHVIIGGAWPFLVLTGTHVAAISVLLPFLESDGYIPFVAAAMLFPATITGAGIASIIKYRRSTKELNVNIGGTISAFLGVTEPLIYGSLLPKGKNFFLCLIPGAIGGLLVALQSITLGFGVPGIFVVTTVTDAETMLLPYLIIFFITIAISFVVVYLFGKKASEVE